MNPKLPQLGLALPALALTLLFGCAPTEELAPEAQATASPRPMGLSAAPQDALAELRAASMKHPVAVFKHSPICPVSAAAQTRFQEWMLKEGSGAQVQHAHIDVIDEKPLARGLVAELGIRHESPQLLLFHGGEVVWHASHGAITGEALTLEIEQLKE